MQIGGYTNRTSFLFTSEPDSHGGCNLAVAIGLENATVDYSSDAFLEDMGGEGQETRFSLICVTNE